MFYPGWLTAGTTYSFRVDDGSNPSVTQSLTLQLQYPLASETSSYPGHTAGEFQNSGAFAALQSDGTVITWGYSGYGGDSSTVASALTGVVQVFSTGAAFAALKSDGTVITWGYPYAGGDSSAVASALTGVVQVFSTIYAFAALKSDGTLITWGDSGYGGDSSTVASALTDVVQVFSNGTAFAALKSNGTLVTWGSSDFGGDSSTVASALTDVVRIFSTDAAFAALKSDGTVITWGNSGSGGDSSAVASQLTSGVVSLSDIYSNQNLSLADTTPPTLEPQNSNPADNATTVAISSDLEVTFSEAIAFGSAGSITLYNVTTGRVAETFDVSTASQGVVTGSQGSSLTLSGSRLTLNPNGNLNSNTQYSLHFTAGSVTDTATIPNPLAAITDNTTYNFTTASSITPEPTPTTPDPTPTTPTTPTTPDPTPTTATDGDSDGVSETVESLVPSRSAVSGDGNGDGIADAQQNYVTSLPFLVTSQVSQTPNAPELYLTLESDSKTPITSITQQDAPSDRPSDLSMPFGLINFTALADPSGSTSFTLYVDSSIAINGYWKQNSSGNWVNLASAEYGGQVVTANGTTRIEFTIKDGGEFDNDGVANGIITDPGALGFLTPTDSDHDQFPDALEAKNGLVVGVQDNDVFDNPALFVMQLYRDVLGREADTEGLSFWESQLDSGALSRAGMVSTFLDSDEFQTETGALIRLSLSTLGRLPEESELTDWLSQLHSGSSLEKLIETDGFASTYSSLSDSAFIEQLYQNILGRSADTEGSAYWAQQLLQGDSRAEVLLNFTQSSEYTAQTDAEVTLTLTYLGLLERLPEAEGYAFWQSALQEGRVDEATVIASFLDSTEYHDRFLPAVALVGTSTQETVA